LLCDKLSEILPVASQVYLFCFGWLLCAQIGSLLFCQNFVTLDCDEGFTERKYMYDEN